MVVRSYCHSATRVVLFVDGKRQSGNAADIRLTAHEEIAVVIGTPPEEVPSTYKFPAGG